jgi:hypothetical protein
MQRIEEILEEDLGGHLIDYLPALFGVSPSFVQRPLRCSGSEPFVPQDHLTFFDFRTQAPAKFLCLCRGGSKSAIHVFREAQDDSANLLPDNDRPNFGNGRLAILDRSVGIRECSELVRDRYPDPYISQIDS